MITPQVLKGTRDYGPKEMAQRNHVFAILRKLFESYGYDTIETPVIEYAETILGKYGTEGEKLTYNFTDHGDRKVALRYDQTVPFARYYAANWHDLPKPFKRYQISRVWRADKPQKGRQREFYQCDVDVIGVKGIAAEVELMQIAVEAFESLGLHDARIRINDRRLLNDVLTKHEVPEAKFVSVVRSLDKLDKIGVEGVKKELCEKVELAEPIVEKLLTTLSVEGDNKAKLAALSEYETGDIAQLLEQCSALGMSEEALTFTPTLARGLDYYTGIVFETVLEEAPELGSVASGGRYEDLCSTFSKESFPGVGYSFGFARLMAAMKDRKMLDEVPLATDLLVVCFSEEMKLENSRLACVLRSVGFNTEMYMEPAKLAKQFKYADRKDIPYVLIQGDDELDKESVQIKNMLTGDQATIKEENLVDFLFGKMQVEGGCEEGCDCH